MISETLTESCCRDPRIRELFSQHKYSPRTARPRVVRMALAGSRLLLIVGAGATASLVMNNSHIADVLRDLTKVLVKHLKEADDPEAAGGEGGKGDSSTAALSAQVRRLTQELRQLASASSRPITVVHASGQRGGGFASFAVPLAVIGAVGYGYMWWKGMGIGDLMYVTKRSMSVAVSSMKQQLEQLSSTIANTRRQLTGRLDGMARAIDDSSSVQGEIQQQVLEMQGSLGRVGKDVGTVQHQLEGLEGKMGTIEEKQDFANHGIVLLCRFVMQGLEGQRHPELVQGLHAYSKSPPSVTRSLSFGGTSSGLKELEFISTQLESSSRFVAPKVESGNGHTPQTPPCPLPRHPVTRASSARTLKVAGP